MILAEMWPMTLQILAAPLDPPSRAKSGAHAHLSGQGLPIGHLSCSESSAFQQHWQQAPVIKSSGSATACSRVQSDSSPSRPDA